VKYVVLAFTDEGQLVEVKPAENWSEAVDIEHEFAIWDYFTAILNEKDVEKICKAIGVRD